MSPSLSIVSDRRMVTELLTGPFDLTRPDPSRIRLENLALALGHICRWHGQVRRFYSDAEHMLLVASLVPPEVQLHAALHDAPEAFTNDIPTPVKHWIGYERVKELEGTLLACIYEALGITLPTPEEQDIVHQADLAARDIEHAVLRADPPGEDSRILCLPCEKASRIWQRTVELLLAERFDRALAPYYEFMERGVNASRDAFSS